MSQSNTPTITIATMSASKDILNILKNHAMVTPKLSEERKQEAIDKVNEICEGKMKALSIQGMNYSQGHPYTIGPKHIGKYTFIGDEQIRQLEKDGIAFCVHPGCRAAYDDHTHEWGMFLQLQCNLENEEAKELLQSVAAQVLEPYQIAGICFVDTPEKFRITKPKE